MTTTPITQAVVDWFDWDHLAEADQERWLKDKVTGQMAQIIALPAHRIASEQHPTMTDDDVTQALHDELRRRAESNLRHLPGPGP